MQIYDAGNKFAAGGNGPGRSNTWVCVLGGLLANFLTMSSALAGAGEINQVPNAEFRGNAGTIIGTVNGAIPSLWRAFTLDAGDMDVSVVPVAANDLYAGSPATQAIRLAVNAFGTDQGFDHSNVLFAITSEISYQARVYVRTGNPGDDNQGGSLAFPIFDLDKNFTGRQSGSFGFTASDTWQLIEGPVFTEDEDTLAHIAFRVNDDGGTGDELLIALPEVRGVPLFNAVPNPGFAGNGGFKEGSVTGTVPDFWRGFGVDGGAVDIAPVPLAANALFPGSPPTIAVQLTATSLFNAEGFDHEAHRFSISHGHSYWAELYMKTADAANTPQSVTVAIPVFDDQGFTGRQPGTFVTTAGAEWSLIGGPSFVEEAGTTANLQFRLNDSGADNSVLIALPWVGGTPPALVYEDSFEGN